MTYFPRAIVALIAMGSALLIGGGVITRARAQSQPQAQGRPGAASPLAAQPLDRLSATGARPLFTPSRRPPAPPPAPIISRPPPTPPTVTLFGVVMDDDGARAIVQAGPASEIRRVGIGDNVSGWKVAQIEARKLVLARDGRLATFTMFSADGKPARNANRQRQPSPPPTSMSPRPRGYVPPRAPPAPPWARVKAK